MDAKTFNAGLLKSALAAACSVLLLASASAVAQSVVTLTAAPTSTSLPDGQTVPMWGYACGAVSGTGVSCTAANGVAQTGGWQPPVITVPSGSPLTITLINNLSFTTSGTPNNLPTSLVIVGQLGGGLGGTPTRTDSPVHAAQGVTWPASGGTSAADPTFVPPAQSARVQSFATEVAAGSSQNLVWSATNLRPGTYLMESGTHPSIQGAMGLYGVLVVTDAAYPGVVYDKDAVVLLSEIDALQNRAVDRAVRTSGFSETKVWNGQNGECGDPTSAQANTCYPPTVNYDPRYYLINGISFDRSHASNSILAGPTALAPASSGNVLLRYVNAGLRMHVPAVVGLDMTLYAEDGNILPGNPRVQSEVFLAAGKTYDAIIKPPASNGTYTPATFPIFDRQLSLSTNNQRDGGMQVYLQVAGGALPNAGTNALANPDTYYLVAGNPVEVSDPAKGVMANDVGIYGIQLQGIAPSGGSLALNANGTFSYTPNAGTLTDSFSYCGNGATSGLLCTTVTLAQCTGSCQGGNPIANPDSYASAIASQLKVSSPGVLGNDTDPQAHPLTAVLDTICLAVPGYTCLTPGQIGLNSDGSFKASPPAPGNYTFSYHAVNSQKTASAPTSVSLSFPTPSGLAVNIKDARTGAPITDYRWIIEEDRTFYIDPKCQINSTDPTVRPASCPPLPVQSLGYNFHTANMPVLATGCVGAVSCESGQSVQGAPAACDVGNGVCHTDAGQKIEVKPDQVVLDPSKRYYLSILPGDGINPTLAGTGGPVVDKVTGQTRPFTLADCTSFAPGTGDCGHAMGGAPIAAGQVAVNIGLQQTPLPTAKISVFVFEDDNPLDGEAGAGGGVDIIAPNEPGLGGFELKLFDQAGGLGDATGQITYDMFNMPVSNGLAGTKDPVSGQDACPITNRPDGLVGMIPTCPKYEADGRTMSPLAGQALIANLYPGLYEVVATPSADRIGRGEEWLQTNTLDGGKAHEAFIKPNEPGYFQEFGPGGFHVVIGFANPKIINDRRHNTAGTGICDPKPNGGGLTCTATLNGKITSARMSRTPDQRLYSSGGYDAYSFTQCYVGLGAPDNADFAFAKCNPDGTFSIPNLPTGDFKLTVWDQWNDLMLDGLVSPVKVDGSTVTKEFPVTQWRTNLYTRTFIDANGDGVSQEAEPGLPLVSTNIHYRDGSIGFFNNTDLNGYAGFNEVFPFMNWLVVETDSTRYKPTGTHVVYDAGGPADGTSGGGSSAIASGLANTLESVPLPASLHVPGARYCASADCPAGDSAGGSTGRVDPPWTTTQGWQGLLGQNSFIEFGMKPFSAGENGGIKGHVIYASTRPFDDPALLLQLSWEPGVPRVKINLYQEGTAADGTNSLKLVDTTTTTSWDDWAQGFRPDGVPNMNCPGQDPNSPFFQTLQGSKQFLNPSNPLPNNAQFKCYDGWSMLNQVQPAPYDGQYKFPSVTSRDPATGLPTGTNCTICVNNPSGDGTRMLPTGKYVVEVIVPPGFELVKEEDKNILLGDIYVAPVTQQFAGVGNIFILPDQAAVNALYNKNNPLNPTTNLGATPRHEGDTGSMEAFWPCVGEKRIVPDFNSLFPTSGQNAPFAGALRPLCDRKEVILGDQASVLAKFYVFTPTHIAGHFTGTITNDFASEFDPFSPQFGEKFGPPNLPVGLRDFAGNEVSRVYSDQWGIYNGLFFSSYGVNPPNPTGYVPQMAIACMNDPGPIPGPNGTMITDPNYNPAYSNFCYETPFMPGFTAYMDTPVIPTQAFAEGYNLPDCDYPDTTPAIASVIGSDATGAVPGSSGKGPWVAGSGTGHILSIKALGDKVVQNPAFSGPNSTKAPFNQKTINRHYGFGSSAGTVALVGSDGVSRPLTNVSWSDTTITGTVPNVPAEASTCAVVQRTTPSAIGASARCAQLVITAGNGKQSIDSVTVTIAGKAPTVLAANQTIQSAIDAATPGDLIIVPPGTYKEMLLMWKPVRLQGVGAASVTINADAHPSDRLLPWRQQVACLFGLAENGQPANGSYAGCNLPAITDNQMMVDRLPLEGMLGWDTSLNGNVAEMLQEPTLMGAYEGAGITVLAKGVRYDCAYSVTLGNTGGCPWGNGDIAISTTAHEGQMPLGTHRLTDSAKDCADFPGNFLCNPSRIDGLTITNSSQGGGGIFAHGWVHNLEISNNRISSNGGTLSGGISIGQGEFPDAYVAGNNGDPVGYDQAPWTFVPGAVSADGSYNPNPPGYVTGTQLPYGLNRNANVHNNMVTANVSYGDELYSATPSAAGGVTFSTGSDDYRFTKNWVCSNLSTGDGGGVAHSGFSYNGNISKNWILFNQSTNPTIPTNGGGIAVFGASPDRMLTTVTECGAAADVDCPPGLSDGTGPGLVIDANLILGNSAESGSGGALRLQTVNGSEVAAFPLNPERWNDVTVTNNIIANNVAGWDGGGVSLQDALKVSFINNTVVDNDTTGSAGVLFKTIGSAFASTPPPGCNPGTDPTASCYGPDAPSVPQPAGLVTMVNTPNLIAALPAKTAITQVSCPPGYGYGSGSALSDGTCRSLSLPLLQNNLFWQNRAFNIVVGNFGTGVQSQQHLVSLVPTLNQVVTGDCASGANYWDIGVRGDTGPADHSGGATLTVSNSILTSFNGGYTGNGNLAPSASPVVQQYCNGSRVPPENGGKGYNAPAGRSETTGLSPVFTLNNITPAATVDEGNNWINLSYGPLSLYASAGQALLASSGVGTTLGAYSISGASAAVNGGNNTGAPNHDFFGNPRLLVASNTVDIGAVEFVPPVVAVGSVTPSALSFGSVATGMTGAVQTLTLHNTGGAALSGITVGISAPFKRSGGTCGTTLAASATCTIITAYSPAAIGTANGTVTITGSVAVTGSPVALSGTGVAPVIGAALNPAAWSTATTRCSGSACLLKPIQIFTLTNTGNTTLTGIKQAALGGANASAYSVVRLLSTCGPSGNGQLLGQTSLAPGASCAVTVRFQPPTSQPAGAKVATLSVTDAAGPQTSSLSGTAN